MRIARLCCAAIFVASLFGSAAVGLMPAHAADPAKPYLGMSVEEIVACAGAPYSRYKSGSNAEILTYHYSGAGPVPAPAGDKEKKKKKGKDKLSSIFGGDKKDKSKDKDWNCTASLVFEDGRLARVSFAHKDVRSPYAWQSEKDPKKREELRNTPVPTCTFSLPNCKPMQ